MSEAPKKMSKKEKEAAEAARLMAERQKAAEDAFSKADVDGSGAVDKEELKKLLWGLLQHQGHKCDATIINEFVEKEFGIADKDGSGDVDFDEFIEYYNKFVDRQTGGELTAAIDDAKKAAALKAEKAAIAEDDGVYVALHTVLTMLKQPSVGEYNGFTIPFKIGDSSEYSNPRPSTARPRAGSSSTSRGARSGSSRRGAASQSATDSPSRATRRRSRPRRTRATRRSAARRRRRLSRSSRPRATASLRPTNNRSFLNLRSCDWTLSACSCCASCPTDATSKWWRCLA